MISFGHAFGLIFFFTYDNSENFKMSTATPEPKAQITHVIFDMDGLLIGKKYTTLSLYY